jgi:cysteine synthase
MPHKRLQQALPPPHCTPMVRSGACWLKLEGCQTTGSVKYRMVYAKVTAALAAGLLHPHSVLTEVTAGSTGVALAYVGGLLGLRVVLHAYEDACAQKCAQMRAHGAEVILHPLTTPMPHLLGQIAEQVRQHGYWHLNQYQRQSHRQAYQALGQEIVQQLYNLGGQEPKIFACPVGTGGLIQGVGTFLRQDFPHLQVVAVEPEPTATIPGMRNTQVLHMGAEDPYDLSFPDCRQTVLPPTEASHVQGFKLGSSAAAVYGMVSQKAWQDVLMIAPD